MPFPSSNGAMTITATMDKQTQAAEIAAVVRALSMKDKILAYLREFPLQPTQIIRKGIDLPRASVAKRLTLMVRAGELVRSNGGKFILYSLPDSQPTTESPSCPSNPPSPTSSSLSTPTPLLTREG